MSWRIAESLKKLREQINAEWPKRDKASDGGIGDERHASSSSDHNPWVKDVKGQPIVTAIDIDEDLAPNINSIQFIVDAIIKSRDKRVKYIIYEGRMCSSYAANGYAAWQWRPYKGTKNPHKHHAHISVQPTQSLFDSRAEWSLGITPNEIKKLRDDLTEAGLLNEPVPEPPAPAPVVSEPPTPAFVPENKEVLAPVAEGSTVKTATVTIGGFVVPTFLVGIVSTAKQAIDGGFVSAAEVGSAVLGFVNSNQKYVFAGFGMLVAGWMLKKLYRQITLWLQMYFAARPDMHNVTVKPQ